MIQGKRCIDMVAMDSYIVSTADFEGLRWAEIDIKYGLKYGLYKFGRSNVSTPYNCVTYSRPNLIIFIFDIDQHLFDDIFPDKMFASQMRLHFTSYNFLNIFISNFLCHHDVTR